MLNGNANQQKVLNGIKEKNVQINADWPANDCTVHSYRMAYLSTHLEKTVSFAEIIQGRDSSVPVTADGMLHAVQLVMTMTGKDRNCAGRDLRDLPDDIFQSTKFVERQLSSRGGYKTKLVSLSDAIELVMVLPGKVAKETRAQFVNVIRRYLAGDRTLVAEIEANARSNSPIAQLARASLDITPDALNIAHKRKLEQLEIAKMEADVEAKRLANREAAREYLSKVTVNLREICQDTAMDERTRLILKDNFLNMAILQVRPSALEGRALITDSQTHASRNNPVSLSMIAVEMGLKIPSNDLISIGIELKKRYVGKYGKEPSKHDQLCNGRMTKVNSYTEGDRLLIEEVLQWHASGRV